MQTIPVCFSKCVMKYTTTAFVQEHVFVLQLTQLVQLEIENFTTITGKNNGFPVLYIFGYFKNTHKNPKFGKVRQVPTTEFPTKFPDWDLSHSSKFGIFVGIL